MVASPYWYVPGPERTSGAWPASSQLIPERPNNSAVNQMRSAKGRDDPACQPMAFTL